MSAPGAWCQAGGWGRFLLQHPKCSPKVPFTGAGGFYQKIITCWNSHHAKAYLFDVLHIATQHTHRANSSSPNISLQAGPRFRSVARPRPCRAHLAACALAWVLFSAGALSLYFRVYCGNQRHGITLEGAPFRDEPLPQPCSIHRVLLKTQDLNEGRDCCQVSVISADSGAL